MVQSPTKENHIEQDTQDTQVCVQLPFGYLKGQRIHNLSVPVVDLHHSKKVQNWTQSARFLSLGLHRGEKSSSSTCWQCSSQYRPGGSWLSFPPGLIADSCLTGIYQYHQVHFCKAALQLLGSQPVLVPNVIPPQGQDLAFPFVDLHEILFCPLLQPVKVHLNGGIPIWCVTFPPSFDPSANMLRVQPVPQSR